MIDVKNEVRKAVETLGYKDFDLEIAHEKQGRIIVFVDGEQLGIYDLDKHTFVD